MTTAQMPGWVEQRIFDLNESAREAYRMRNTLAADDTAAADGWHQRGDILFEKSLALLAEWGV